MQKKWKTTTILGTVLLTGVLAFSTALVAVSCSNNVSTGPTPPTEEKYVNNRPARGFYYQYDKPNDQLYMKQMIQYIYDNNVIRDKFLELGYRWPEITNIEFDSVVAPAIPIPGEVFAKDYDDPVERYKNSNRKWFFKIYFEITDSETQKDSPCVEIQFHDWKFSFTSPKYIKDVDLWRAEDDLRDWISGGGIRVSDSSWNAPLKFNYTSQERTLFQIFNLYYSYGNAVDTWYIINQWDSSWPKTREQYWDEMADTAIQQYLYWERVLPIK